MRTFNPDAWHDVAQAISAMVDESWADESMYTDYNGNAYLVPVTIDLYVNLSQDDDLDAETLCDLIAYDHSHIIVRQYDSGAVDVTGYGKRHESATLDDVMRAWHDVVADMTESPEDETVDG